VAGATVSRASAGREGLSLPSLQDLSGVVGGVTEALARQAAGPRKRAA
jgi:hypothetical protein